jgi:hypothetical protein
VERSGALGKGRESTDRTDRKLSGKEKAPQIVTSHAVDKRAVNARTVDNPPFADDSRIEYRPYENPANSHITNGAGDAVGIWQRLSTTTSWSFCVSSQLSS